MKNKGLGRGIEALFSDNEFNADEEEQVVDLSLSKLRANPFQPRNEFDTDALNDLAESIKKSGVFQPIIVRLDKTNTNAYQILAGERRFRASKLAGKDSIPAIIRTISDEQMMEIAILENLQREDLSSMEEAEAYASLMDNLHLTQAQVAQRLGKSRPYIANYLRLLKLPYEVQELLKANKLSMGQARTLLAIKDKNKLVKLALETAAKDLTVRQLEKMINDDQKKTSATTKSHVKKSPFVRDTEQQLRDLFGTSVLVNENNGGKGKIEIDYSSNQDLNRILQILNISLD
ncbi:ParB/RepB/Spo0J family partition protein [Apilactobacillus xinyiensis]|uniref:ParB/RepB/Spo0J family partition protein n=1 Tax=Apilactobacillus xinyiensis TaxID=2841032 RepID=UPI00200E2579|nr:ParB/RepB/Spo0J family partition protein [Apilactobacillus xinyiensis]MCL0318903.1 ParB/RepB/Spo0J family partition protein [Apilactobacillus xinyiensis]MCL0330765.1 ParB/RepB/Spo0J family partition protein [Apilactobacillus xinyiensis]